MRNNISDKIKFEIQQAVEANIKVHTALVDDYNNGPHFNMENKVLVRSIILEIQKELIKKNGTSLKLLDMGCGTGFIIDLSKDLFSEVYGIDATEAMLKKVDTSYGNIVLHKGIVEDTPFKTEMFDLVTAYSFMDHLADCEVFLNEVYRLIKPNGVFFSDLNPNRDYWQGLSLVDQMEGVEKSETVLREIRHVTHNDQVLVSETGLDLETVKKCESYKSIKSGFSLIEITALAKKIGFKDCHVTPHWFMGEAKILHGDGKEMAIYVDEYLRSVYPSSSNLFKYLRFVFYK
jgi:2-polyprenyl-3-methyl-5-hydroxy-6-metoxy-1,4-benzoquinol methylase